MDNQETQLKVQRLQLSLAKTELSTEVRKTINSESLGHSIGLKFENDLAKLFF